MKLTLKDSIGCCNPCGPAVARDSMLLTIAPKLSVAGTVTHHVLCNGSNEGAIDITGSGGTAPYSYAWSNEQITRNITGLTAGTYTVTVTDAITCVATGSWTVTEPVPLSIGGAVTHVSCYTYSTGVINATYGGGVTPYKYLWSNTQTTSTVSGLSAGFYTVTVTDANTCTLAHSWEITQPSPWSVGITGPDVMCCSPNGTSGEYCATVSGDFPPLFTYQWIVVGGTITGASNTACIHVTWSCCGQGTVSVMVTKPGPCQLMAIKTVTINPAPSPMITGPALVFVGQTTGYCTPEIAGHLYSWTVIGGSVSWGQDTHCITVTWGTSCAPCNGSVTVYETYNGCTGTNTLPVTIIQGLGNLTGSVTYDNSYNIPLGGVTLTLHNNATGAIAGVTNSGPTGNYSFSNIADGSYQLTGSFNGTWGGNNATDALLIQLQSLFITTPPYLPLTGLKLICADVSATGMPLTALDALYVKLRTIGMISSYPAGDWKFSDPSFTLTTSEIIDMKGLCEGDVNGSYIPVGLKETTLMSLIEDGAMMVPVGEPFVYNIHCSRDAGLGAMTLFLGYDQNRFEVIGLASTLDGMKYVIGNGRIAIAWADTKPLQVNANDLILSLNMRVKDKIAEPSRVFTIKTGSEFADITARPYDDFNLKMPNLLTPDGSQQITMYNFPNPFANTTTIVYYLPEQGHTRLVLTDLYGKTLRTLTDRLENAGSHSLTVDPSSLNMVPGVYLYKIIFESAADTYVKVNKMVFTR